MKNNKFIKALIACLSCLLLVGVVFGVVAVAESTDIGATSAQVVYKNVAHKGAPGLVYYVKTDAPLAQNQKLKLLFWEGENVDGIYSEHNATYSKYADQEVSIDGVSYYAVVAEGVAPANLRSTIVARPLIVNCDENGNETETVFTGSILKYSVFDFVIDVLSKDGGAASDQVDLYTALLDYAAAVQQILFTNQYNGKINTDKLAAAGGWADAYYVVQLNRYIYNSDKGAYAPSGDYVRYYARNPDELVTVNEGLHYTVGETVYSFRGYRNMDDSYILDNNSIVDTKNGISIGHLSLNSEVCSVYAKNPGVNNFKVLYGVNNVEYLTYDGKTSLSNSKNHAEFWAQYNVKSDQTKDKLGTVKITEYYYNGDLITYFYTSNGLSSTNMNDYHYAAISSKTNDDGSVTETLKTGTISANDASKYTYVDINDKNLVVPKEVTLNNSGYLDWVADPLAGDGEVTEHGNVLLVAKHIYDMNDKNNPNELPYELSITPGNINATTSSNFVKNGYVYLFNQVTPSADGKSGTNKIGGINVDINSISPDVVFDEDEFPVHTFETDILVDAYTTGFVTQVYLYNGSNVLVQFNIGNDTQGGDEFYINVNAGLGKNGGRYDAGGNAISANLLAGKKGSDQVGKKLYQNTWYNLRVEYVAAGDNALMMIYINDELVSYVSDAATTASDDKLSSVRFFNLNASRKTFIYLDNTTVSTSGKVVSEIKEEFTDVSSEYYVNNITLGGGTYYEQAEKIEKGYRPANGALNANRVLVEETLPDGETNYALKMLKLNQTSGFSATVPVDRAGGNYYIFETDIKVIGSDNKSDWMLKFSFQNANIASPSDTQEIIMPTIGYKDPGYWTFITGYSNHQAKLKLDEWHNIRFEYNPATGELKTWINQVPIDLGNIGVTYTNGIKNSTANFAGVSLNVRAKNSTYTEVLFDNMYATTAYSSSFANGEHYTSSEKYDNYVATGTTEVVEEGDEVKNKYLNTSGIELVGTPANPLGHDYIFETDIRWNGITGFDKIDDTTAKALAIKLYSESGEILSIDGLATDLENSDLILKVGTTTATSLVPNLWMNLKVVYTPGEVEEIDGIVTYSATYSIYVNNAPLYTATVSGPDMKNLRFEKAVLTVGCESDDLVPSISIDNTYTGTRYNDYYKKGQNFASSNQFKETVDGKTQDKTYSVVGSAIFNPSLTIGSSYMFETDYKWVEGVGTIALSGADSAFFTMKVVPSDTDPRYADIVYCTTDENGEEIQQYIQTIYTGIWYNIQVAAKTVAIVVNEETEETRDACMFVVKISGIERLSVEKKIDTPFVKAVFGADIDNGVIIDNLFCEVLNSNYSGKGEHKEDSIGSFIDAGKDNILVYDKSFAEADPDGEFTDGYVSISKNQITVGKGTAISNLIKFINTQNSGTTKHVFEADMNWGGSVNGVMQPIAETDKAVYYQISLKGAEDADLLTIYAVGSYAHDVAQPEIQFVNLYTSLDDVASGNAIASLSAEVWHNLRVEYNLDGKYSIFVNNEVVATGTGAASNTMSAVSVELCDGVYDTTLSLKYVYVSTDTVTEDK